MSKKALLTRVKELTIINMSGTQYLGVKEKTENGFKITSAIESSGDTFEEDIKNWIKADNINQLTEIEEEGQAKVASKKFTEQQEMKISSIVADAEYAMKYAVGNLQNNSF